MKKYRKINILLISCAIGILLSGCSNAPNNYEANTHYQIPDSLLKGLIEAQRKHYEANPKGQPTPQEQRLLEASAAGDSTEVIRLIKLGTNVNCRGVDGATPLSLAMFRKDLPMVEFLKSMGADVNAKGLDDSTSLIDAVSSGDLQMIEFLLRNGADPRRDDGEGTTALAYAAQFEDPIYAEILLKNGADPNSQNKSDCRHNAYCGYTPLHWASSKGYLKVIKLLLDAGAKVNVVTPEGETPLNLAKTPAAKALLINKQKGN